MNFHSARSVTRANAAASATVNSAIMARSRFDENHSMFTTRTPQRAKPRSASMTSRRASAGPGEGPGPGPGEVEGEEEEVAASWGGGEGAAPEPPPASAT